MCDNNMMTLRGGDETMSESDACSRRGVAAVLKYGLAVLSITAALFVAPLLRPGELVAPVFFLAIMLSAWVGGLGAGAARRGFAHLLTRLECLERPIARPWVHEGVVLEPMVAVGKDRGRV